ncbi:Uracil-DNA glycosylase [Penicillium subrubescens]|uniref:Uracil-DNA glycosylase n=1 Tax=Penicillium subrubescens TaxID=1316194 RepID=UPI002545B6BE|nr:Uracil-DNA glycosylase [Penicillium subrubescens]KAJ5875560.1 Uracil-DNA glycosylase [Penicillium subrubescens]
MVSPALKRNADHLSGSAADPKKPKGGSITSFFGVPKPKALSTATNGSGINGTATAPRSSTFNKEKWVASLTPEQKELLQLEIDTLDESWLAHLKDEIVTTEFLNLKRFLKKEKEGKVKIFPPEEDVYSWSRHTPLHTVKAVIIGQDPYHNDNQAHGLCFSVRPPTRAPPSLVNIYKGIKKNYPDFVAPPNNGGLLIPWAERGVLMLNTCLTVRAHVANSHSGKGWEKFTQKAIDLVARVRSNGVVFLAWGKPAGTRVAKVNRSKHCVLQSVHPSPLSAHGGFFDNGHFKKCNDWLAERYGQDGIIDWSLVPTKNAVVVPPVAEKENSAALANVSSSPVQKSEETVKSAPVEDEFDDDDALEALVAAEKEEEEAKKKRCRHLTAGSEVEEHRPPRKIRGVDATSQSQSSNGNVHGLNYERSRSFSKDATRAQSATTTASATASAGPSLRALSSTERFVGDLNPEAVIRERLDEPIGNPLRDRIGLWIGSPDSADAARAKRPSANTDANTLSAIPSETGALDSQTVAAVLNQRYTSAMQACTRLPASTREPLTALYFSKVNTIIPLVDQTTFTTTDSSSTSPFLERAICLIAAKHPTAHPHLRLTENTTPSHPAPSAQNSIEASSPPWRQASNQTDTHASAF